jgi:RND family efflux transporter MFP subunit
MHYSAATATDCELSPRVTNLSEEAMRAMFLQKLRTGVVLVALAGLLAMGGRWALGPQANARPEADPPEPKAVAAIADPEPEKSATAKSGAPRAVTVARPFKRQFAPYRLLNGQLDASRSVDLQAPVNGVVHEVLVKPGAEVKKGDLLLTLESEALQLNLKKAITELELAQAKRKQFDAELASVRKGFEAGRITREDLDRASAQLTVGDAGIELAKLEVARVQLDLDATKIRAPISGQIGQSIVEPGTRVIHGPENATALATISCLDPLAVFFRLDQDLYVDYQRLVREKKIKGIGGHFRVTFPTEENRPRSERVFQEGTVVSIDDRADPGNGTVGIRGSLANPDRLLLPGLHVSIRMPIGPPSEVLAVPAQAIRTAPAGPRRGENFVLVVTNSGVAERRWVTLGDWDDNMMVVRDGLSADDRVIISDSADIAPGDRVNPVEKTEAPKDVDNKKPKDH